MRTQHQYGILHTWELLYQCFASGSGWLDPDPNPGGQKWPTKIEQSWEISCFEVLDVLKGYGLLLLLGSGFRIQWIRIRNTVLYCEVFRIKRTWFKTNKIISYFSSCQTVVRNKRIFFNLNILKSSLFFSNILGNRKYPPREITVRPLGQ